MVRADLAEVLDLEGKAFDDPWTQAHFEGELNNPHATIDLLRAPDGSLLGYVAYWIIVDEAQLLDVAVHPDFRRRGLGRRLVTRLVAQSAKADCQLIVLEVRRSNTAAVKLYESLGFEAVSIRKRYYAKSGEDAIVMHLTFDEPQAST